MTDHVSARELALFAANDYDLYRRQTLPIIANLKRKIKRGVYDPSKALKLWGYLAESAAKDYTKQFCTAGEKWFEMFPPDTRREAASQIARYYDDAVNEE